MKFSDIATSYQRFCEYVDPCRVTLEQYFDGMSHSDIAQVFADSGQDIGYLSELIEDEASGTYSQRELSLEFWDEIMRRHEDNGEEVTLEPTFLGWGTVFSVENEGNRRLYSYSRIELSASKN